MSNTMRTIGLTVSAMALVLAVGAADAGEAVLEVAAPEKVTDGLVIDRSPVAELSGIAVGVDGPEVVEVFPYEPVEIGFDWLTRAVDAG